MHISDIIYIDVIHTILQKNSNFLANPICERKEDFLSCSAIFPTRPSGHPQAGIYLCLWSFGNHVPSLAILNSECYESLSQGEASPLRPHHPSDSFFFFCGELGTKWYFATLFVLSSERWTSQSGKTRIDQTFSFQHSVSAKTVALHHELRNSVLTSGWFSLPSLPSPAPTECWHISSSVQ